MSSWSKVWDVEGVTSLAVLPIGVCSRSEWAAEAARGGERQGRLRRDEEVLDAPEELRQPVIGVGGAKEEQGQEKLAL